MHRFIASHPVGIARSMQYTKAVNGGPLVDLRVGRRTTRELN